MIAIKEIFEITELLEKEGLTSIVKKLRNLDGLYGSELSGEAYLIFKTIESGMISETLQKKIDYYIKGFERW